MIAFGIDPGSVRTGWGAIRVEGSSFHCIECGVIRSKDELPLATRLELIFKSLTEILARLSPDRIFLEAIFHHKSARSALVLGHARGVALLAAALRACPIGEVTPAEVKKAVTGNGRADKSQVQEMVRIVLGLEARAAQDASDALAIAIAGAMRAHFDDVIEAGRNAT